MNAPMSAKARYLSKLAKMSYPELLLMATIAKMPYLPHEVPYAEKMTAMLVWLEDEWDLSVAREAPPYETGASWVGLCGGELSPDWG